MNKEDFVRVVARKDAMRAATETWMERDGVLLTRVARKMNNADRKFRLAMQLNGRPIPEDKWGETRAFAGDLINMTANATFSGFSLARVGGLALGAGSLAAMWLLGRGSSGKASTSTQSNTISPPPETPPDPPLPPQDNYGGAADTVVPPITGVANRSNNWGPIPRVYGRRKVYPVVVAAPYFLVEGGSQWMYVVLCAGIGQLDLSELKIGETSFADLVAANVLQYEIRYGSPSDYTTPLTLYTRDVNTVSPGNTLTYGTATLATTGQDANELSVDIMFPNGLYGADRPTYDITLPGLYISPRPATDFYDNVSQSVSFTIEYRLHGTTGAWTSTTATFTDNNAAAVIKSFNWTVATAGIYDVKVTKTTADTVTTYDTAGAAGTGVTYHHYVTPQTTATWSALRSIRTAAPINTIRDANGDTYPLCLIALKIKDSVLTNNTIENCSCIAEAYLPTYSGGAWQAASKTRSPAWAFVDALTGFINNSRLPKAIVDAQAMADWATYCSTNGFYYDRVVDEFTTVPDLLNEIASHGNASVNCVDGVYTVVVDNARSTVVQMFTPANTDNFSWSVDYPDYPDGVKVKFCNPDADWAVDERTVYADGKTVNNSSTFNSIDYVGLTDATGAYKLGRHQIAAVEQRPIKYEFDCDVQHIVCKRGDLVRLNYDASFDGLFAGLIKSVTDNGVNVTGVTLDQAVTMEAGKTYGIQIRCADGATFISKQVTTAAGTTTTLTFTTPFSLAGSIPARNDLFAFGELGQEAVDCLVESIDHNPDDLSAHIVLVDYSPSIQNAFSGAIPAYTPNVDIPHPAVLPVIDPPNILSIVSDESVLIKQAGAYISRIMLTIDPPTSPGVGSMQAQYKLSAQSDWHPAFSGPVGIQVPIVGVTDGAQYDVRVRFGSSVYPGINSDWSVYANHTVVGQSTKPPDVTSLRLQLSKMIIKYDAEAGVAVPVDFVGFEIRWAQGTTATWDNMFTLTPLTSATEIDLGQLPPGAIVVGVKAVDAAGNQSENAAYLYKNVTDTYLRNQYLEVLESPTWGGTKTNGTVTGNELWADASTTLFWGAGGSPFWTNPSALFWGSGYLSMQYEWTYIPPADLAKPYKIFVKTTSDGTPSGTSLIDADVYFVEYKRNSQSRFWPDDTSTPFWGAPTDPFWEPDPAADVWLPVPQEGLDGARELYTFRITCLASSARRPKLLEGIGIIIDVPDVQEDVEQVIAANGGSGTALSLTKTYRQIRQVQLTVERDPSYPTALYATADLSVSPPVARVYNSSGTVVDGKVLATIRGI